MKNNAVLGLFLILASVIPAHAQEAIPGLIPRFYSIEAATDLQISPEIAHERALKGEDLSLLEPDPTTNIWRPTQKNIPDHKLLKANESVQFIKELPSRNGQVRFTIQTADKRELIVILSKKIHNNLLKRNILSKLGYSTQPMSWVPKFKLNFANSIDRDLLKEEMKDKLLAGIERWVVRENDLEMDIQDALILTSESDIYNLASGVMISSYTQGRRLMRAPYIPLALVDTTESINLFPWQAGRVILSNLKMNHTQDLDTDYGPSWEDARWIGRRMSKLTRADFEEIVQKSYFPKAVELLLVEKILNRRNDLMKLLDLATLSPEISIVPDVSYQDKLVDGEITQEFFDGYASRFSYGDPESPFSASELGSFALSRVQGQLIDTALGKLNKIFGTDDNTNYSKIVQGIVEEQGIFFPTHAIAIPTFHGAIIVSRDIVTGSYMGTNNKVQLVDNIGVALDAGVFGGVEGLQVPMKIKGGANLSYSRVYSHVKPVQSLKKSMKEPYKNLLVPLLLRNLGHKIDALTKTPTPETEAAQAVILNEVLAELKATLGVGESFIVTDSLIPRIFGDVEFSPSQIFFFLDANLLKIHAKVSSERMMVSRFHFHRPNENTFQIYQDRGKGLKLIVSLKLKSYIPIINFNARWNKATAETKFYPLSLRPRDASVELLKALRISIMSQNNDALAEQVKPHVIDHKVGEKGNTFSFLIWKRNRVGSNQTIDVVHSKTGEEKIIHRRYDAVTTGTDYESYATETVNLLVSILTKSDLALSQVPTLNPGFTLFGKARNKIFTSEFDGERMSTGFQRIFNGWRVKPAKLLSYIRMINDEVGEQVFDPLSIQNTDSILLYQLSFLYSLTQEGTTQILAAPVSEFKRVLQFFSQYPVEEEALDSMAEGFHYSLHRAREAIAHDPTSGMKKYHSWLKDFQDTITIKGLASLAGKTNIAYQGKIEGFRQGDENGDSPLFSHVYGDLPVDLQLTPTQMVMQNLGIIEGEMLLNWMMERAL